MPSIFDDMGTYKTAYDPNFKKSMGAQNLARRPASRHGCGGKALFLRWPQGVQGSGFRTLGLGFRALGVMGCKIE